MNEQRTYYHTCKLCGANLDPGESCDCQKEKDDTKLVTTNVTEKSEPIKEKENNNDHLASAL